MHAVVHWFWDLWFVIIVEKDFCIFMFSVEKSLKCYIHLALDFFELHWSKRGWILLKAAVIFNQLTSHG